MNRGIELDTLMRPYNKCVVDNRGGGNCVLYSVWHMYRDRADISSLHALRQHVVTQIMTHFEKEARADCLNRDVVWGEGAVQSRGPTNLDAWERHMRRNGAMLPVELVARVVAELDFAAVAVRMWAIDVIVEKNVVRVIPFYTNARADDVPLEEMCACEFLHDETAVHTMRVVSTEQPVRFGPRPVFAALDKRPAVFSDATGIYSSSGRETAEAVRAYFARKRQMARDLEDAKRRKT